MHHVQHGLLQLPRILRVERLVAFFGISFEIGVLQGSVYTSVFKQDITQQLRAVRPGQYTANIHGEGIGSCQQAYVSFLLHHRGEVFAGADAFVGSVEYLASADVKTTVNNIRAFEDGDKVFLQTIYNFAGAGEQVAFDIFRFDENGKIAEHWDVMETIADQSTWQNQNGKF